MLNPAALEALKNNQRQLDMDGCEVGVSRQALDELIAAYESLATITPAEVRGLVDAQTEAREIETQAWCCDEWPEWLHKIVDETCEVADRLDMSAEQAHAYAVLAALAAKDAELAGVRGELEKANVMLLDAYGGDVTATELFELHVNAAIKGIEARAERAEAQLAEARKALEPFAWIGQWLFARDLPDETPVVMVEGAGKPFALTRGMFKAAHTAARRALTGDQ